MDSIKMRNYASNSRLEILDYLEGLELGYSKDKLEDIAANIFLRLLMLKFLARNRYIENSNIFKQLNFSNIKILLEKEYDKLRDIFKNVAEKKLTDRLIDGRFLESDFMKELVEENIIKDQWQEVEIIGWLYQYYMADESKRISSLKRKYKKEEIALATQVFTPKWMVKFITENSLGRYLIESNPSLEVLKENWDFYLDEASSRKREPIDLKDIKVFDPALGSGNILVYAFDLFYQAYLSLGYAREEIPSLIFKNNIYGLEIDNKVQSIACFALVVKAREKDPKFFEKLKNNQDLYADICYIEEPSLEELEELSQILKNQEQVDFIEEFKDAKIYGSLLKIRPRSQEFYSQLLEALEGKTQQKKVAKLIDQARLISSKYHVTITNPPYMGTRYLNDKLRCYIKDKYPRVKYDLFSAFISYCLSATREDGQLGLVTPYVWMFISSYEDMRKYLIENKHISSLVQLEYSAFSHATVPVCIFTMRNYSLDQPGVYIRLSDFKGIDRQEVMTKKAISQDVNYKYFLKMEDFKNIPKSTLAYWADKNIQKLYRGSRSLEELADARQGIATGDNKKFLSLWHEVDYEQIEFKASSIEDFHRSGKLYAPYNKGGMNRKWYGNLDYVIKFDEENYQKLAQLGNKLPSKDYYFKEALSWSFVSSSYFSVRYSPPGRVFDVGGSSIFPKNIDIYYLLGILCSKVSGYIMNILNPTLNYQVGDVKNLVIKEAQKQDDIKYLVRQAIDLSKKDWDSFESSSDFRYHPILRFKYKKLENNYNKWLATVNYRFKNLKYIEEEINHMLISSYGLEDSLDYRMKDRDITIHRIIASKEARQDSGRYCLSEKEAMTSFISYIIGLALGRFSIDGQLITGEKKKYSYNYGPIRVSKRIYYREFPKILRELLGHISYGKNIEEDIKFIRKKLQIYRPEDIDKYFIRDYKKYHMKIYKNRPVYRMEKDYIEYF